MKPLMQFTCGDCRVSVFNLGYLALDGGAMFGVVPRVLWSRLSPPDELNRINLATNCLLIELGDEKIMVDTGCGNKFDEKHRGMYGLRDPETFAETNRMPGDGNTSDAAAPIVRALASVGLTTTAITKVIFTHLHFDHAGGATRLLPDGSVVPAFENAQYIVHAGEWEYGSCPHERCKASYLKENLAPMRESGRLTLITGKSNEIAPGLWQIVTGGHTPSHQIVVYDPTFEPDSLDRPDTGKKSPVQPAADQVGTTGAPDAGKSRSAPVLHVSGAESPDGRDAALMAKGFIYWGDLIPTRHHLKIPYVMGYDEYPVETMAAKRRWLKPACERGWLSLFEHDPDLPACHLQATGKPDVYSPLSRAK